MDHFPIIGRYEYLLLIESDSGSVCDDYRMLARTYDYALAFAHGMLLLDGDCLHSRVAIDGDEDGLTQVLLACSHDQVTLVLHPITGRCHRSAGAESCHTRHEDEQNEEGTDDISFHNDLILKERLAWLFDVILVRLACVELAAD